MITLVNNKFTNDLKIKADSAIFRGFGIFETLRADNKIPQNTKLHLQRLNKSAKSLNLKLHYNQSQITKMLQKVAKKSKHKHQRIKIIALPKKIIIVSTKLKHDPKIYQGVKVKSIITQRSHPEIKSISYLPCYLANQQALSKGYFDALLIDKDKQVYECAYANLFWVKNGKLYTRKSDILPGITRQKIIKSQKVKFQNITLSDLKKADEVFLTSSLKGVVPITKIDRTKISNGKPGHYTTSLIQKLSSHIGS